jgi:uncharacterized protein (DUF1697 family)
MTTYISILRGINVGGNRTIKMDALRQLMGELGCSNVKTYIQSGNVVFQSELTEEAVLEQKISEAITTKFGFDVPVMVINATEWSEILAKNPFLQDKSKDAAFIHLTFLAAVPTAENTAKIQAGQFQDDDFCILDRVVYLYCPNGYSNSKLSNNFLENKLKTTATTRNWKTCKELLSIATQ